MGVDNFTTSALFVPNLEKKTDEQCDAQLCEVPDKYLLCNMIKT